MLIQLLIFVVCCSIAWIVFERYLVPIMPAVAVLIIRAILALVVIIWLLDFAGLLGSNGGLLYRPLVR